jgi:hypothetical protein
MSYLSGTTDGFDEEKMRYRGLRCGQGVAVSEGAVAGVLIKPERAQSQVEAETKAKSDTAVAREKAPLHSPGYPKTAEVVKKPIRFHGTAELDPARTGRDAARIADEIISHLVGMVGSDVRVTLEIEASTPDGVPDQVVRIISENARTLKFKSQSFEAE